MNTLYIDPIGGIAGDMLCAALLDIGLHADEWRKQLSSLNLDNYEMHISKCMRNAFSATHLHITPTNTTPKDQQEHTAHPHHNGVIM